MITTIPVQESEVAVMGLGASGLAAARGLVASGARVLAWDDCAERRAAARRAGIRVAELTGVALRGARGLVLSPGIPHTHPAPHPVVARAHRESVEIVSDIELLARAEPSARYLGVTGTNGKSTTVALLGQIFARSGERCAVGGNIGTPALGLDSVGDQGLYVLELSSYQLELTRSLACEVGVLLNISPDHLERHGGLEGYVRAKARLFEQMPSGARRTAVIGIDDPHSLRLWRALADDGRFVVVPVSAQRAVAGGVYADRGRLVDATEGEPVVVADLRPMPGLVGAHNAQNAAAAYAAARAAGAAPASIVEALIAFSGLGHRQELVDVVDGVTFVNDSKATNGEATAMALRRYEEIYWIAGGVPKSTGLGGLESLMHRVRRAFLIGAASEPFAAWLDGKAPFELCEDLEAAVRRAHARAIAEARPGAAVLLSPACAAHDQFRSFEARGDAFAALVEQIARERAG